MYVFNLPCSLGVTWTIARPIISGMLSRWNQFGRQTMPKYVIFSSNHLHLTAIAVQAASGGPKAKGKSTRKMQRFPATFPALNLPRIHRSMSQRSTEHAGRNEKAKQLEELWQQFVGVCHVLHVPQEFGSKCSMALPPLPSSRAISFWEGVTNTKYRCILLGG